MTLPNRLRWTRLLPAAALALTVLSGCRSSATPPVAVDVATTPAATAAHVIVLDTEAQKRGGISVGRATATSRGEATEAAGIVALNEARTARIGSLVDGIVMSVDVEPGARVKGQQQLASLHSHAVHDSWAGLPQGQGRRTPAGDRVAIYERRGGTRRAAVRRQGGVAAGSPARRGHSRVG